MEAILDEWTAQHELAFLETTLQAAGIAVHRLATLEDLAVDPQVSALGMFLEIPHPLGGASHIEATPFSASMTPGEVHRPAPHFGRDQLSILTDFLGYDAAHISDLSACGALA